MEILSITLEIPKAWNNSKLGGQYNLKGSYLDAIWNRNQNSTLAYLQYS